MNCKHLDLKRKKILWVINKLEDHYGKIEHNWNKSPLETLIQTVLSQNTTDTNRDRAWTNLGNDYSDYNEMASASINDLASTIRPSGLQRQKAKTIKEILNRLNREHGSYDLNYLLPLPTEQALAELKKFRGVGKKTAGVVLLFSMKKPYFPVDTHIKRLSNRIGLVGKKRDYHGQLNQTVPDHFKFQLHLHLIRHGREVCKARKPRCSNCILLERCDYGQSKKED